MQVPECLVSWGKDVVRKLFPAGRLQLRCPQELQSVELGSVCGGDSHIKFCLWTWLFLQTEVTPSPSVYRLTSKDDKDLEMCLITDYSPEKLTLNLAEKHTSAVVEVATAENREESSYLSTYWAKRDEMQCGASHEGFGELEGEDPDSGASTVCVTGLSLHFRTDEHLNTLSLSQLGLKIVLMKGLIFNVLMTMLMWKKKTESNQVVQS